MTYTCPTCKINIPSYLGSWCTCCCCHTDDDWHNSIAAFIFKIKLLLTGENKHHFTLEKEKELIEQIIKGE